VPFFTPAVASGELSTDSLLGGAVVFQQPRRGYRVNVDSVLLATFAAEGRRAARAVDLGAGVGVVGLVVAHLGAAEEVVLVEREPELAELATKNLGRSRATGRVVCADLGERSALVSLEQTAELVVSNPPFFRAEETRAPREAEKRRARVGKLGPFLAAAARVLAGHKARAVFAYPAPGLGELLFEARAERLVPKRLRLVHPFVESPARLALVELRRSSPAGLVVEAPLVEWLEKGVPTPALAALSAGRAGDRK
jgi:tRNA1Val (adenine37-N6)-methyltransferase